MTKQTLLAVNVLSTYHFAKKESGGKGFNLYLLNSFGINVPSFITLPPLFFETFKEQTGIKGELQNILLDKNLQLGNYD